MPTSKPSVKKGSSKSSVKAASVEVKAEVTSPEAAVASGLAGAATPTTPSKPELSQGALKNFRHHPDMENFYRFIYENDLRYEALHIFNKILRDKALLKQTKAAKAKAH